MSNPDESTDERERRELTISAAELAVLASKKTGNILPRHIYEIAGVEESKIPKDAGDELIKRPARWWQR